MTKVISFVAQKGGSGKSTMTKFLANYLAYKEKKNIVVIDGDAPQYSLYKLRQRDDSENSTLPDYVLQAYNEAGIQPYNIICAVVDPTQEKKDKGIVSVVSLLDLLIAKGDIDYIFIDLAGTINSASFVEILLKVNYIFVPFMEASDLFESNMEVLLLLSMIAKNGNHNIKCIYEFWHKYRYNMPEKIYNEMCSKFAPFNELFKANGIEAGMMQTKIGNSVSAFGEDLHNTIIAPPKKYLSVLPQGLNLGNYIKEFMSIVNN